MLSDDETMKPIHTHHSPPSDDASSEKHNKNKELDREIRNMVNALIGHITDHHHHHKPGSSIRGAEDNNDDDHDGVSIITLAGSNTGATMRSQLLDDHGVSLIGEPPEPLSTYVNSNFQAVNCSIMLSSRYTTNDPGVHLDITDVFEPHGHRPDKHGKKGKKKVEETFKSDHHSGEQTD